MLSDIGGKYCALHRALLLTESSKPSREGDVVKPEESTSLMGGKGQVGEVVVGGGQGGEGGHLGGEYQH